MNVYFVAWKSHHFEYGATDTGREKVVARSAIQAKLLVAQYLCNYDMHYDPEFPAVKYRDVIAGSVCYDNYCFVIGEPEPIGTTDDERVRVCIRTSTMTS
jgi:hypothetical protein